VQKVPDIMDVAQDLIDRHRAILILTGSSKRKLRRGTNVNMLPGRVIAFRLDLLIIAEAPADEIKMLLLYGSLPKIFQESDPEIREQEPVCRTQTSLG
jgi:uncharacterized protein